MGNDMDTDPRFDWRVTIDTGGGIIRFAMGKAPDFAYSWSGRTGALPVGVMDVYWHDNRSVEIYLPQNAVDPVVVPHWGAGE